MRWHGELADRILAIEAEARATPPVLDVERLIKAGFLDAYLNIDGVKDEAEARAMLEEDAAEYARLTAESLDV